MIQLCSCLSQNSGFNCPSGVTMTWELLCNSLMYSDQYPGMIMKIVVMMPGTWQHCLWSHHHPSLIMKTRETCQDILLALLLYHQAMSYIYTVHVHNFPFKLALVCFCKRKWFFLKIASTFFIYFASNFLNLSSPVCSLFC